MENPHDESLKTSYKRIGILDPSYIQEKDLELSEEGKWSGISAYSLTRRMLG
jgi:hypothetical protein